MKGADSRIKVIKIEYALITKKQQIEIFEVKS